MDKPTIFFSHSTKDKNQLLKIKQKFENATGGVLEIFMSSDGQSIPFGQNWVHKIEQGLEKAKIMFVFVTPNSINSNWIYFEAGFAYSKGIEVIPVGIGVDIALLKPPLNLLQGFNIITGDSLNNFIATINHKFDYHFEESFSQTDFTEIASNEKIPNANIEMSDVFEKIEYQILAQYGDENEKTVARDLNAFFEGIMLFLNDMKIQFSFTSNNGKKSILFSGVRIVYAYSSSPKNQVEIIRISPDSHDKITFSISPYHFCESVDIFNKMMQSFDQQKTVYLKFWLNRDYKYMIKVEQISSILSKYPLLFKHAEKNVGSYFHGGLRFSIFDNDIRSGGKDPDFVLVISYDPSEINPEDINELFTNLIDKRVIRKE